MERKCTQSLDVNGRGRQVLAVIKGVPSFLKGWEKQEHVYLLAYEKGIERGEAEDKQLLFPPGSEIW